MKKLKNDEAADPDSVHMVSHVLPIHWLCAWFNIYVTIRSVQMTGNCQYYSFYKEKGVKVKTKGD